MFSQTAEYALRAVVYLAEHPGRHTAQSIAASTQIPKSYLAKVLQNLGKHRVVHGQRGLNGGFTLSRPAQEISIYDVLQAVDPLQRIEACPLNLEEHQESLCMLHRRLDEALGRIEQGFRNTPVSDLLETPTFARVAP